MKKIDAGRSDGNPEQTDLIEGGLHIVRAEEDGSPSPVEEQLGGVQGERHQVASVPHHQVARITHATVLWEGRIHSRVNFSKAIFLLAN